MDYEKISELCIKAKRIQLHINEYYSLIGGNPILDTQIIRSRIDELTIELQRTEDKISKQVYK